MNGDQQQHQREAKKAAREAAQRVKAAKAGRDAGSFVPWLRAVQLSAGYRRASHTARSLLMDMLHSGPNGALSASAKYLRPLGWLSDDVVRKAVRELIACGLLHETRKGMRPNVSARYACTWLALAATDGLDSEAVRTFKRGVYLTPEAEPAKPQKRRTAAATAARQMQAISRRNGYTPAPSDGALKARIAPSDGALTGPTAPSDGAVKTESDPAIAPSDGPYLEIAICPQQRPAAQTRFGRLLVQRIKPGMQPGYAPARARHS